MNGGSMTGRRLTGLAVICAVIVSMGTSMSFAAQKRAADFTLRNPAGVDVTLSELLEDGPVVVDFWAMSCKPCLKAFPDLQEIFDNYKDCGLTVVAVSVDGSRTTSKVGAFVRAKGNTFEVVLDPSMNVARKYHVTSIPRTVLVDTNGNIVYAVTGYRPGNHDDLVRAIEGLIPGGCPESDANETVNRGEAGE